MYLQQATPETNLRSEGAELCMYIHTRAEVMVRGLDSEGEFPSIH